MGRLFVQVSVYTTFDHSSLCWKAQNGDFSYADGSQRTDFLYIQIWIWREVSLSVCICLNTIFRKLNAWWRFWGQFSSRSLSVRVIAFVKITTKSALDVWKFECVIKCEVPWSRFLQGEPVLRHKRVVTRGNLLCTRSMLWKAGSLVRQKWMQSSWSYTGWI